MLIEQLNERLDKTIRYPVQGKPGKTRNVKERDIIQHEAHALANKLLGKSDMPRIVETKQLWAEDAPAVSELPEDTEEEKPPLADNVSFATGPKEETAPQTPDS